MLLPALLTPTLFRQRERGSKAGPSAAMARAVGGGPLAVRLRCWPAGRCAVRSSRHFAAAVWARGAQPKAMTCVAACCMAAGSGEAMAMVGACANCRKLRRVELA